ncbi:MAG TPA: hypothetical protein VLM89_17530 [Phycisphaerae bacterium]|nr:hypothetical protein [Phycisphaerae bacterium]
MRKAGQVLLAVDLTVRVADGFDKDRRQIRLAGRGRPSSGGKPLKTRDRLAAARTVAAGCRPADLARLLAAIAHPQRIAMLRELLAAEASHKTLAKLSGLKPGPLYYHIRELRTAGLIGPKVRDLYLLTRKGRRLILATLALGKLVR